MDEINVPSFTNDRYYEGKEQYEAQHAKKTGISKLKVAKTTVRFLAAGVVLALVVTNPYVQDAVNIVIDKAVEEDDQRLDAEMEHMRQEVFRSTGSTPEEIVERGKSR